MINWRAAVLAAGGSVKDAITSLNESGLKIVLVVDEGNKLIGTISDGDIRRGVLSGLTVASAAAEVTNYQPVVVPDQFSVEAAQALMLANTVSQLPIVNDDMVACGLYAPEAAERRINDGMTMVIMAGGKGVRLMPHTEACPKPMVEISGKPMMEHILLRSISEAVFDFVVSVNHLGAQIKDYFKDGTPWGVKIRYIEESRPLGTVGSLSLLTSRPKSAFIVSNGDVLSDIKYRSIVDYHCRYEAHATMVVQSYDLTNPYGSVCFDGIDLTGFEEKPVYRSHINAGIYVLAPEALDYLEHDQYCDMPTLLQYLMDDNKRVIIYPMHEPWLDVGRPSDLAAARAKY